MEEDFVPFEIAKKLKEKRYRELCLAYYTNDNTLYYNYSHKAGASYKDCYLSHNLMPKDSVSGKFVDAPTISQVLKWLRDKNINCLPHIDPFIDKWFFYVMKPNKTDKFPEYISKSKWDSYEKAIVAGIEYCLDNLI